MNIRLLQHFLVQPSASTNIVTFRRGVYKWNLRVLISCPFFSTLSGGFSGNDTGWDSKTEGNHSDGLNKDHSEREYVGHQLSSSSSSHDCKGGTVAEFASTESQEVDYKKQLEQENSQSNPFMDRWGDKLSEVRMLLKHIQEPVGRSTYLMPSEIAEMYRLHKEKPEVYTIKRLAQDYKIMKQRVHSILWLKELEEEEEKTLGFHLDNSVKVLLDTCPEFFKDHDVGGLSTAFSFPDKPDLRVMPQGWDAKQHKGDPDDQSNNEDC